MKKSKLSLKESAFRFLYEQEETKPKEDSDSNDEESEDSEKSDEDSDEPEPEVDEEDEQSLEDSIDSELDKFFGDAEEAARKSSVINNKNESKKYSLKHQFKLLFESPADDIDLKHFASETARLIKNYQNLIDWETVILNKAQKFIDNHYGPDTAKTLMSILEDEYQIVKKQSHEEEDTTSSPISVGARDQSPA
jgi:hypothetical protein